MKADLTRNTFQQLNHFSRVIMQQGRVQLDADWNEQTSILLHYLRSLAADIIGPQGGPSANFGFGISPLSLTPPVTNDFRISLGHYYVDGILCEADSESVPVAALPGNVGAAQVDQWTLNGVEFKANQLLELFDDPGPMGKPAFSPTIVQVGSPDKVNLRMTLVGAPPALTSASNPKLRRVLTYLTQPDYPVPAEEQLKATSDVNSFLIYLDVWERHVTYIEDDAIREVALGGPDTATRARVVWQVKAVPGRPARGAANPCDNFNPTDPNFLSELLGTNRGELKARAKQVKNATDPCILPPDARYRGPENQLYRVEIHRAGGAWDGTDNGKSGAATFKWSRENGSVTYPVVSVTSGGSTSTVVLENLGRDDRYGLAEGEWVELVDDNSALQNRIGNLLQVQSIDRPNLTATLTGTADPNVGADPSLHPLLRRWDHSAGDPAEGGLTLGPDGTALVQEDSNGTWLSLEDGVEIQFEKPDTGRPAQQYHTGDYWLIPARTATGDVEWPTETDTDSQGQAVTVPLAKPPDGIAHHYAPLAVITVDSSGTITVNGDCRKGFDPIP